MNRENALVLAVTIIGWAIAGLLWWRSDSIVMVIAATYATAVAAYWTYDMIAEWM